MSSLLRGSRHGTSASHCTIPATLKELRSRLELVQPELQLNDPTRPVVFLAQVGNAWRTLAFDSDVLELFTSCYEMDARSVVNVEVRDFFPKPGAELVFVKVPLDLSSDANVVQEGCGIAPTIAPTSPSATFKGWCSDTKIRPGHKAVFPLSVGAKVSSSPASPLQNFPVRGFPESPLRKFPRSRPSSAPAGVTRKLTPSLKINQPPNPPKHPTYDSRPGRTLDKQWAGTKAGTVSAHILEAFGLRDEYERLQLTSSRSRAALEKLLEARESVPGVSCSKPRFWRPDSARVSSQGKSRLDVDSWEEGEFTTVASRDIPELRKVIQSLQAIEGEAAVRLNDDVARVLWRVEDARKRICEEKSLAHGRIVLAPKQVLVESHWLSFCDIGSVAFRFYPHGDGSAADGASTLFLWLSSLPRVSFAFNLHLGRARHQENGAYESVGAAFSSAPRLWQASMVHYRIDVGWSEIAATLLDLADNECLEFTLQVLQWHENLPLEQGQKEMYMLTDPNHLQQTLSLEPAE